MWKFSRCNKLTKGVCDPVKDLKLNCKVYGVRYPQEALSILKKSEIQYLGWLPNYKVPQVFSQSRFTIHVPRRPKIIAGVLLNVSVYLVKYVF